MTLRHKFQFKIFLHITVSLLLTTHPLLFHYNRSPFSPYLTIFTNPSPFPTFTSSNTFIYHSTLLHHLSITFSSRHATLQITTSQSDPLRYDKLSCHSTKLLKIPLVLILASSRCIFLRSTILSKPLHFFHFTALLSLPLR